MYPSTPGAPPGLASPFHPDAEVGYGVWRRHKLEQVVLSADELLVEVRDPRRLTPAERDALVERCQRLNMALYATAVQDCADKAIPRALGAQLGLRRVDCNWLADDDAITSLTVRDDGPRPDYIPYTNRPLHWHTDGYYNPPERQIHGLILHCVHPAAEGGHNRLLDHELAYMLLRDRNPDYIRALMQPDAMTIPARRDGGRVVRPARPGPVFSITGAGDLHMRYTARARHVIWKDDLLVREAVKVLEGLLETARPYVIEARLERGMGLVCNNVLHDRAGFRDAPGQPPRLLYRARYYDRIASTGLQERLDCA